MSVYLLTPLVGRSGDAWVSPLSRRPDPRCLRFHHEPVLRHRIVTQNLALENPYLDTAYAICRVRFCFRIVHIGAQGVQWNAAFAIPFDASNLRPAYTTTASDTNTFRDQPQSGLQRALPC